MILDQSKVIFYLTTTPIQSCKVHFWNSITSLAVAATDVAKGEGAKIPQEK